MTTGTPNRRPNPTRLVILLLGVAALAFGYWYFYVRPAAAAGKGLIASGTIEAVQVHLGTQFGGRVEVVNVEEGEQVKKGQVLAQLHPGSGATQVEEIRSPINGTVLERTIEPGELTAAGSTLLTIGNLYTLDLTVYVSEDRYGQIYLGQSYPVTVDSFPGQVFEGKVIHIADQAEFTPRNVETVEGRKNTVFAIRLSLSNLNLDLKPGMPADVNFGAK